MLIIPSWVVVLFLVWWIGHRVADGAHPAAPRPTVLPRQMTPAELARRAAQQARIEATGYWFLAGLDFAIVGGTIFFIFLVVSKLLFC